MAGDGTTTSPTEDPPENEALQALACFGLQPEEPIRVISQPKTCEVWPEHWRALILLSACQSQWQPQLAAMGGVWWRGAQWVNVAQAMRFMSVPQKEQPELWQQYRVMEAEALTILQQRADEQARKK